MRLLDSSLDGKVGRWHKIHATTTNERTDRHIAGGTMDECSLMD
jgi:hypothetical protein